MLVKSHFITECTSSNNPHWIHRGLVCENAFDGNWDTNVGWGLPDNKPPGHAQYQVEEAETINTVIFRRNPGGVSDFTLSVEVNGQILPINSPSTNDEKAKFASSGRIRLSPDFDEQWVRIEFPVVMGATGIRIMNHVGGTVTEIWLLNLEVDWSVHVKDIIAALIPNKINPQDQHTGEPIGKYSMCQHLL